MRSYTGTPDGYDPWVSAAFFPSYATVQSATDAYKSVLSDVGASQPVFDDHDVRMVTETRDGTYTYSGSYMGYPGIPDHQNDVGGYEDHPTTSRDAGWDSDGDGVPDWWESAVGSNVASPAGDFSDANLDSDGDGFTMLDDYLNWMAEPHYFTSNGQSVAIDLGSIFFGYTSSPSYTTAGAVGGSVNVSGSTVTFTPSACGLASFTVSVQDGGSSTMTRQVGVHVEC